MVARTPCTGCRRLTSGKTGMCRACFTAIPARERTGTFGDFQLNPSHLVTGTAREPSSLTVPGVDSATARAAARTVALGVPRDAVVDTLAMLGILEAVRT